MAWFRRTKSNIETPTVQKDLPDGSWIKCDSCETVMHVKQLAASMHTCLTCGRHFRISSQEYLHLLLDPKSFKEQDRKMHATDPLAFHDTRKYSERIKDTIERTRLHDAIRTGLGTIEGRLVSVGVMDFGFIGGSMGSVVGEKIARAVSRAIKHRCPLILVSTSGGARMMEGAFSLMQMAKTSARLTQLSQEGLPFISILMDPTTGGVTASFAMLGDIIIAEPGALVGFAGPRVIKQTIGKDLPEGFQRAEFLLDKGFVDLVVSRKEIRSTLARLLDMLSPS